MSEWDSCMTIGTKTLLELAKPRGQEGCIKMAAGMTGSGMTVTLPALIWHVGVEDAFDVYMREIDVMNWRTDHRTMAMASVAQTLDLWPHFSRVWTNFPSTFDGKGLYRKVKDMTGSLHGEGNDVVRLAYMLWIMLATHKDVYTAVRVTAEAMKCAGRYHEFRSATMNLSRLYSSVADHEDLRSRCNGRRFV